MKSRTWNRPLPEIFLLGGGKRFDSNYHRPGPGWMLRQTGGEPCNLMIEPYPGVLNKNVQVSPIFSELSQTPEDPDVYNPTCLLKNFSWDWVEFHFQLRNQLEVRSLYWVPDSGVICGENWITNNADHTRVILFDLICSQQSHAAGKQIILEDFKGRPILTGKIGEVSLVLFLIQDPVPTVGPYSSLQTTLSVPAKKDKKVQWICTLADSKTTALEVLEGVIHLDWPGEISHLKVAQQAQLEITTGDSEWDFALALSQKQAKLIINQFTSSQQPDPSLEDALSPFQAMMLLRSMQPLEPEVVKKILKLVFKQILDHEQSGKKPGKNITPPLLVTELLWRANQMGLDNKTWSEYLPAAVDWLENWFTPDFDTDRDGIPESTQPLILDPMGFGAEDSIGVNQCIPYPYLESPGLGALLFNEICKIEELIRVSGTSIESNFENKKECLLKFLRESQNPDSGNFQIRDSHSHHVMEGFIISEDIRPGLNILRLDFQLPTRIGIQYQHNKADQTPVEITIIMHGRDLRGNSRIEEIHSKNFTWGKEANWGITESVYSHLDFCTLKGSASQGQVTLVAPSTSDQDITLTLPLWAEILSDGEAQFYINNVLLDPDQYWSPYGFRTRVGAESSTVKFSWNMFLGQALMRYGKQDQAADLIGRWMAALIPSVTGSGSMYPAYHAETGIGSGINDSLESLFPVSFFLQVLGIQFIQDRSMIIKCQNPFHWPVKLNFRGVTIECGRDQTTIFRPGQDPITLTKDEKIILDLV